MAQAARYLEAILHHDIPLTRAMGLKVLSWEARQLRLGVPLAANINHKSSMFGGSLYCAAVLAGWGWLHLRLHEAGISDGHIVIQQGKVDYPVPALGDVISECSDPGDAAWDKFVKVYQRHGRARINLHSRVLFEDKEVVTFSGQFVLHR
ncbi:thioesterase domain-containing protein [Atopomonas sediminilitoris]|uniref:thioesterase domain-containing protein n=1 Tax=Atopomonas sediminilitoris TaxID=2919919 RepID=UPI001F4D5860|nr:thioesterase domain-containing protein [Atopomonas sediminilitoris]MCJ8169417.1 thioesterase domain-containing protein [Atopomonas sediminilitoris]